jgi:hypothetical protein
LYYFEEDVAPGVVKSIERVQQSRGKAGKKK